MSIREWITKRWHDESGKIAAYLIAYIFGEIVLISIPIYEPLSAVFELFKPIVISISVGFLFLGIFLTLGFILRKAGLI